MSSNSYSITINSLGTKNLGGIIQAPASKSSMQRACAAALVTTGKSIIKNPGESNDDKAALDIIQKLGATINIHNGELMVSSEGVIPVADTIDCGESGLSIRMFTPVAAVSKKAVTITGTGSLLTRPMNVFDAILPQLNVQVKSNEGKIPLHIQGPLIPRNITVDGSLSSQFLTGILMAYAAANASNVTITVNNLKSKPYIDLTLDVMKQFNLKLPLNKNYYEFYFDEKPHKNSFTVKQYTVEGDWSGGAFLLVAGAVAGNITIKALNIFSTQADKKILEALRDCGCKLSINDDAIEVATPPLGMQAFHFNATDCPDLFPPLVTLAAYCKGKTVIEGVSRLAHKESDRATTLQQEFGKMGLQIILQGDLMIIEGGVQLKGALVHSHHDHRIAMACAVAALKAKGDTTINEAGAINKSYPHFYDHIKLLGAAVSLHNNL
jgi:3-phosphoshikimate 1-carboxyvinyltransferase